MMESKSPYMGGPGGGQTPSSGRRPVASPPGGGFGGAQQAGGGAPAALPRGPAGPPQRPGGIRPGYGGGPPSMPPGGIPAAAQTPAQLAFLQRWRQSRQRQPGAQIDAPPPSGGGQGPQLQVRPMPGGRGVDGSPGQRLPSRPGWDPNGIHGAGFETGIDGQHYPTGYLPDHLRDNGNGYQHLPNGVPYYPSSMADIYQAPLLALGGPSYGGPAPGYGTPQFGTKPLAMPRINGGGP